MLISNFNLCKSEWLELVFAKRNKEYGAYYLRQQHPNIILRSFAIGVFGVVVAVGVVGIAIKAKPVMDRLVMVKNNDMLYVIPPAPKVQPPKPKPQVQKPAAAQTSAAIITNKFPPPVVTPDQVAQEPPKIDEIKGAVGQADVKTGGIGLNASGDGSDKAGTGVGTGGDANDNNPFISAELMPQPIGGDAAWAKFLQRNIQYPDKAIQNGISGKVYVTFIIEKDGQLSNIKVVRGQGYGMDEEAVRVLKLAKPWKPGMQNGQPVRVQLTLPVVFTLGEY